MKRPVRQRLLMTWLALMVLLAITVASSLVGLGRFNLSINLAIAAAKALLVATIFMELRASSPSVRLAAIAGLMWLLLLCGLALADFLVRLPPH